jgi:hypothetical protein
VVCPSLLTGRSSTPVLQSACLSFPKPEVKCTSTRAGESAMPMSFCLACLASYQKAGSPQSPRSPSASPPSPLRHLSPTPHYSAHTSTSAPGLGPCYRLVDSGLWGLQRPMSQLEGIWGTAARRLLRSVECLRLRVLGRKRECD